MWPTPSPGATISSQGQPYLGYIVRSYFHSHSLTPTTTKFCLHYAKAVRLSYLYEVGVYGRPCHVTWYESDWSKITPMLSPTLPLVNVDLPGKGTYVRTFWGVDSRCVCPRGQKTPHISGLIGYLHVQVSAGIGREREEKNRAVGGLSS